MTKRTIAVLLALFLLLSVIPAAYADDAQATLPDRERISQIPMEEEAEPEAQELSDEGASTIPAPLPTEDKAETEQPETDYERVERERAEKHQKELEAAEEKLREESLRRQEEVRAREQSLIEEHRPGGKVSAEQPQKNPGTKLWASSENTWLTVKYGETVTLKVDTITDDSSEDLTAAERKTLTYQWYDADTDKEVNSKTDTYTTAKIVRPRNYYCKITGNVDGYTSSCKVYFYVHVENHLEATANPDSDPSVKYGETAKLKVKVTADNTDGITCKWCKIDEDWNWTEIEGATGKTYTTPAIKKYSRFVCTVTDKYENTVDVYFYVHVDNELNAVSAASNEGWDNRGVAPGEKTTLKVKVTALNTTNLTYTWYRDWEQLNTTATTSLTTGAIKEARYYQCVVTDKYGNTSTVYFEIYVENNFSVVCAGSGEGEEIQDIPYGEAATLKVKVTATDKTNMTYVWSRDDSTLSTTAKTSYSISAVKKYHYYSCYVSDQYGNSNMVTFFVRVDNDLRAVSTKTNESYDDRGVAPGKTLTLKVKATAKVTTGMTYQWYRSYFKDGFYYTGAVSGATTASCTTPAIRRQYSYWCVVTDKYGNTSQVNFYIYVENNFNAFSTVTGQNKDTRYLTPGSKVTLKVKAEGIDTTNTTCKWRKSYYKANGDYVDEVVSGSTGKSLTTPAINRYTVYTCMIQDRYGSSSEINFTLIPENYFVAYNASESRQSVAYGKTATLKVGAKAKDTTNLTYKWYRYKDGRYVTLSATGATLTTGAIKEFRDYRCEVKDRYGTRKSIWFEVSVNNAFQAVSEKTGKDWETRKVTAGRKQTLKVTVSGKSTTGMTYQWHSETWSSNGWIYKEYPAVNGASLTTAAIKTNAHYYCYVTDKYGNTESVYFTLIPQNHFSVTPVGATDTCVTYGTEKTLKIKVSADDKTGMTYRWYGPNGWIEGCRTSCTVTVKKASNYHCEVTDRYGTTQTVSFYLWIGNNLQLEAKDYKETVYASYGKPVTLTVKAGANNPTGLTYTWYAASYYEDCIHEAASSTYTTPPIYRSGTYTCAVRDRYGNEREVTFMIRVRNKLSVTGTSSASGVIYVSSGSTKTLKVSASATSKVAMYYQWYGGPIDESGGYYRTDLLGTSASCSTGKITKNSFYDCVVYDKYGNCETIYYDIIVGSFANQKPSGIVTERTMDGIAVAWGTVPGAAKYQIQRKVGSATSWTTIATVSADKARYYVDKNVKVGSKYKYAVRGIRSSTYSKRAIADQMTCKKLVTGVKVTGQKTQVKVTWKALSGAKTYNVIRFSYNHNTNAIVGWKTIKTGVKGTSFTDTTVVSGTEYWYAVQGVTASGSKYTYDKSGSAHIYFVTAPKLSTASATTSGVKLTWKATKGTGRYAILRKAAGATKWTRIGSTNQLSYTDTTAKKGTKYTYTIRSLDVQGKTYVSKHNTTGKTVTAK